MPLYASAPPLSSPPPGHAPNHAPSGLPPPNLPHIYSPIHTLSPHFQPQAPPPPSSSETSGSEPATPASKPDSKSTKSDEADKADKKDDKKDGKKEIHDRDEAAQAAIAASTAASISTRLAALDACIPSDAFSPSERAQFYANISLAFPHSLPSLHLCTSTSVTSSGERYHYAVLISFDPAPSTGPRLDILVEGGKFRGRHQEKMGPDPESGSSNANGSSSGGTGDKEPSEEGKVEGPSFAAKMLRSLYCAVEEIVEDRIVAARGVRRRERERERRVEFE